MFPRLSETFIRNEILELERHGLALRNFSLKPPVEAEVRVVSKPLHHFVTPPGTAKWPR
jgi:hypothetical protein